MPCSALKQYEDPNGKSDPGEANMSKSGFQHISKPYQLYFHISLNTDVKGLKNWMAQKVLDRKFTAKASEQIQKASFKLAAGFEKIVITLLIPSSSDRRSPTLHLKGSWKNNNCLFPNEDQK